MCKQNKKEIDASKKAGVEIVKAKAEDVPRLLEILEEARRFMRRTGNLYQWNDGYPSGDVLLDDITKKQLYVMKAGGEIHALFAFVRGADPTYSYIEGAWLSDSEYGTIHRIASDGQIQDVLKNAVQYCFETLPHLRIDTHEDNKVMQHVIEKCGFQECGIIYLLDGSPRIAYEKI